MNPTPVSINAVFRAITLTATILAAIVLSSPEQSCGQRHDLIRGDMPPGVAADLFRMSHPSLVNHVQPVRVVVPTQSLIEFASGASFMATEKSTATAGMMIGPVYRLKITNIALNPGREIYPSIEVVNRLTPPAGHENDFPIQVVITQDDLQNAIDGRMVTRVIYLEDPRTALPHRHRENVQPSTDIGGAQDPLRAAEGMGRPMAILRIGSRVPLPSDRLDEFNFHASAPDMLPDPQTANRPAEQGVRNPNAKQDEYIFDGDDRGEKVHISPTWDVYGLDTEDTIGHFDTLSGRRIVTPSNRVAIYAPRFGAVRQVAGVFKAQFNQGVGSMEEKTPIAMAGRSSISLTNKQHLALQRNQSGIRASGLIDRTRGVTADNTIHLTGFRNSFEPYEDLQLMRLGKPSSVQSARLSLGLLSAGVWQDNLGLQVVTKGIKPIIVKDVATIEALVATDSEDGFAVLRVTKIASKISARAGEEVEFTIRFDNLSNEKIGNVTLIDNLTRRLEYVPGSAECSLAADFVNEQNAGGSLMLRWEVTDPVEPHTGGVIRFKCRVR